MNEKQKVLLALGAFYIPDMKILTTILFLLIPTLVAAQTNTIQLSEDLQIIPIRDNVYIHKSFTDSEQFGRFSSNGLIYIQNGEALVADTPTDTLLTQQIIEWITSQEITVKAIIVNHHHEDALGGLKAFHKLGIPSYGYEKTKSLAEATGKIPPEITFSDSLEIPVGGQRVIGYYFGEAHTVDNITLWLPQEQILFGGCMIKSLRAGKGNQEDANVQQWSNTVSKIKHHFPDIQIVIPGHGKHDDSKLLDVTIEMFKNQD